MDKYDEDEFSNRKSIIKRKAGSEEEAISYSCIDLYHVL